MMKHCTELMVYDVQVSKTDRLCCSYLSMYLDQSSKNRNKICLFF